jgi:hypothetical protein
MAACVSAPERPVEERPDLGRFFEEHRAQGTFVLLADADGRWVVYNPDRADAGFLPASTFKILNSLVSLETGVIGLDETNLGPRAGGVPQAPALTGLLNYANLGHRPWRPLPQAPPGRAP